MSALQKNPYVGPRTFQRNEGNLFFGREREASDLIALVATAQLVVFYAQSGAGKSSIVNTRLIPNLEEKEYEVLPTGRVSGDAAPGINVDNIYVYNLLRSLEQHETDPAALSTISISDFLAHLKTDEKGFYYDPAPVEVILEGEEVEIVRRALVIDQFEELFSTHPEAWEKRDSFFQQLTQAMRDDPYLWVVLVMREDYIAALDPYAHLVFNGLRVRYYMQRLSREAGLKAVKSPVAEIRPYADGVAEKLIDDLCSIKVQRPDGTLDTQPGQYMEPVQMQVVCYGLWENLAPEGKLITAQDLQDVGDVNQSLGKYYDRRVNEVAKAKNVKERLIREWFEKKLITAGGIRNMVLQDRDNTNSELDDDVIQALQSDLVRAEKRGGATWYELTHDRLVAPILTNNKKWFDENLSPLQRQATLWRDQEENPSWLLRDQALVEVEEWAKAHQDELTETEEKFLEACRKQRDQFKLQEQAKTAQRAIRFTVMALTLTAIAVVAAFYAGIQSISANSARNDAVVAQATAQSNANVASTEQVKAQNANATAQAASTLAVDNQNKAEASAAEALSGNLAAKATSLANSEYRLALLLGLEAYSQNPSLLTRTTLFQLLQFTPYTRYFDFGNGIVSSVAVSQDGSLIAAAGCGGYDVKNKCIKGGVTLYTTIDMKSYDLNQPGDADFGIVYSLAFYKNNRLAVAGCVPVNDQYLGCAAKKGQITIWDVTNFNDPRLLSNTYTVIPDKRGVPKHNGLVKTVAFSPDGTMLASGSNDQTIILWSIDGTGQLKPIKQLEGHYSFVNSVAFSSDGQTLVSASDDKTIRLWDVSNPQKAVSLGTPLTDHKAPVNSIAFSHDGKLFASASNDNTVILWQWDEVKRAFGSPKILLGHIGYVTSLAFSPDDKFLASAGFDNSVILWDAALGEQIGPPLSIHSGTINSIAFGKADSSGLYLISGSDDHTMIRWDLAARQPVSRSKEIDAPAPIPQLQAAVNEYQAEANGQQIDLTNIASTEPFLVINGFNKQVVYVGALGGQLVTIDQNQQSEVNNNKNTIWAATWVIDPKSWVQFACYAVGTSLSTDQWSIFSKALNGQSPKESCVTAPTQ